MAATIARFGVPFIIGALVLGSTPAAVASPSTKGNIVLFGSSSVNDAFGDIIADTFQREGYPVVRRGYPSVGLARPDFRNVTEELPRVPIDSSTAAVLIYLGGNDAQPIWLEPKDRTGGRDAWVKWDDPSWSQIYARRAKAFVNAICARGARRVVILPPVDVVSAKMQQRLERIRALQAQAAAESSCGRAIATTGDADELGARATQLRGPGGVHMTHAGARRVWARVGARVRDVIAPRE